jgi:hypothetical protein
MCTVASKALESYSASLSISASLFIAIADPACTSHTSILKSKLLPRSQITAHCTECFNYYNLSGVLPHTRLDRQLGYDQLSFCLAANDHSLAPTGSKGDAQPEERNKTQVHAVPSSSRSIFD